MKTLQKTSLFLSLMCILIILVSFPVSAVVRYSQSLIADNASELPSSADEGQLAFTKNNGKTWKFSGTKWQRDGEKEDVVKLTSDVSTALTSFSNATGLSFTAKANTDYIIEFWIMYTTAAPATGINLAVNGPASPVAGAGMTVGNTNAATIIGRKFNAYNTSGGAFASSIAGNNIAQMSMIFRNGVNEGTFILRFASEVAGSAVTIKAGSILKYREID